MGCVAGRQTDYDVFVLVFATKMRIAKNPGILQLKLDNNSTIRCQQQTIATRRSRSIVNLLSTFLSCRSEVRIFFVVCKKAEKQKMAQEFCVRRKRLMQMATWFLFLVCLVESVSSSSSGSATIGPRKLVVGVDGGTESIRACCFDAVDGTVVGKSHAVPYTTFHPHPGWAEQDPAEWWENLGMAVRGALESVPGRCNSNGNKSENNSEDFEIVSVCIDTTCCSVVVLDEHCQPLRKSLLWMDARSASQTEEIMNKCRGDPALAINCGGEGPLSAEWLTPKSLWVQQNEPDIWKKATTVCEYQDYMNFKLTGVICASSCNAASRWHWDGEECLEDPTPSRPHPGRPTSMYEKLGIPELADKLPQKCLPMGSLVGSLTEEAAKHLNLPKGLPVAQGGPDAFVGMIGLGCINPGQLCLITGSSHLHCFVSAKPTTAPGTWGAYRGAPLPGINFIEGGQSSTGSIIRWAKKLFGDNASYKELDQEASEIPPGSEGLVALETFQGSRTPVTDPLARGALVGLTLSHTRAHVWRALMEAVALGTRGCIQGLSQAGHACDEIIIAGGATRSPVWLQMHADVSGKPVVVCENADAPLLGCAILASVGVGVHKSVKDAVSSMVRVEKRVEPTKDTAKTYTDLFNRIYSNVSPAVRPIVHSIASIRGGSLEHPSLPSVRGGGDEVVPRRPIVSPSLLASDWANMRSEVKRCIDAGVPHLHVDIFDGVYLDSPLAFTFGPQMVEAIRKSCSDLATCDTSTKPFIDLHMCVDRPERFVKPMADAGADRFIFQWEAMGDDEGSGRLDPAIKLATEVASKGMRCGVSINPSTEVEEIYALLSTGLIDLVDILAVEPGFGGQKFQESALSKLRKLVAWRDREEDKFKSSLEFMVDGGVNEDTASKVLGAGADIVVAGSFLFNHPTSLEQGVKDVLSDSMP